MLVYGGREGFPIAIFFLSSFAPVSKETLLLVFRPPPFPSTSRLFPPLLCVCPSVRWGPPEASLSPPPPCRIRNWRSWVNSHTRRRLGRWGVEGRRIPFRWRETDWRHLRRIGRPLVWSGIRRIDPIKLFVPLFPFRPKKKWSFRLCETGRFAESQSMCHVSYLQGLTSACHSPRRMHGGDGVGSGENKLGWLLCCTSCPRK